MDHERVESDIARRSALIYVPISLGVATLFLLATSLIGGYNLVAILGGTFWVGLLSLIISMPVVTDRLKKKRRAPSSPG